MRVDLLPTMVLASALSISSGAWIGYKMSVAARAVFPIAPKTVPLEATPVASEVGELHLRPTTIYGARPRAFAGVLPFVHLPPSPEAPEEPKFFDFHHAYCDEAEGTHGKVLRCSKLPR